MRVGTDSSPGVRPTDRLNSLVADAEASLRRVGSPAIDRPSRWGLLGRLARRIGWRLTRVQIEPLLRAQHALSRALMEENVGLASIAAEMHQLVRDQQIAARGPTGGEASRLQGMISRFTGDQGSFAASPGMRTGAVEVSTDVGTLLMPEYDQAMLHFLRTQGTWEPSEAAVIRDTLQPGMTALDLGAHVGYRTLLIAGLVGPTGRVLAVEAEPSNFRLLAANLYRHGVSNAFMVQLAAGDEFGSVELAISENNSGDNRLFAREGETRIRVDMAPLDDVLPGGMNLDFVKCDLQGYEMRALKGMERTLRRCHPAIVVEFCPGDIRGVGDTPESALAFYRSLGYRIAVVASDLSSPPCGDDELISAAESAEHHYVNLLLSDAS